MPPVNLTSWNLNRNPACWAILAGDPNLDVALLQEAQPPPTELGVEVMPGSPDWSTGGARRNFCTAVARLSDRVGVRHLATQPLNERGGPAMPVSLTGSIALAELSVPGHQPVTVASVYCAWESVPQDGSGWIVSDAAAHRVLSDLSGLIETQKGHRLLVAGDWNLYRGYGDRGSDYWRDRYHTVFDRAAALGLVYCGPQHPNGSQADPWPEYLPTDSGNVPTYRRNVVDPATAVDQLDFVFASEAIADLVTATALNRDWGPSDHCRVRIELDLDREPVTDPAVPATPVVAASPVERLAGLLTQWAEGFAAECRASGTHGKDASRSGELAIGSRGLVDDECSSFLRAYEAGLVTVESDGRFWLPAAGHCSRNLHLIGRSGDAVALHTEYLIQIGAYGELVLDLGWDPADLQFEMGEFDILGLEEGRTVLAVEAKARIEGSDSLTNLRSSFLALQDDPDLTVPGNHRRKWDELVRLLDGGPVEVAMVAADARWAWSALKADGRVVLTEVGRALSW